MSHPISESLKGHYQKKFEMHGPTAKGVDWGKEEDVVVRHGLMHDVILKDYLHEKHSKPSLLDVGCGYGGFYKYLHSIGAHVTYTGIDVVSPMIEYAQKNFPSATFLLGDFLEFESPEYDYVVCSGIMTQKLTTSILEMDAYANTLIRKMFARCKKGIAFNVMTSKVNFMVENLYYRHPADLITFCLSELSTKVRLEHSYKMFEYTVYVYKT